MHARPQIVRAYWQALCRDGLPPTHDMIDPRGIAPALENAFIGERIGRGLVRLRLAGSALADLCGMEMHGMPLSVLFDGDARPRLADAAAEVLAGRALAGLDLVSPGGFSQPRLTARLLLLPLRVVGRVEHRVLGCLVADGPGGRAPRKFAITRARLEPFGAAHNGADPVAKPAARVPAAGVPEHAGLAEPPPKAWDGAPEDTRHAAPARVPYLRLVHSTDGPGDPAS